MPDLVLEEDLNTELSLVQRGACFQAQFCVGGGLDSVLESIQNAGPLNSVPDLVLEKA